MARRTTLKDLNEFLAQNPNDIEVEKIKNKEEFIKKSPNNIVDISTVKVTQKSSSTNFSAQNIAKELHAKAEKEGRSFTELWLNILEEGAKIDPLLQNTSVFKTIKTINQTTFNVAMEGLSKLIKSRR